MSQPLPRTPRSDEPGHTRIVGLGASAGGLEVLTQFLAHVPAASGLAYVVVQHLDPTHKAMLAELLQRGCAMPVHEATEAMRVEPDVVYVIPPNTELTVAGDLLHLAHPAQPRGLRLPIDVLFGSLARDQGERAVGVVLSGMGSDGTLGLQAIRARGGLTLAQSPESASFNSMPHSAIAAGVVDIVALPAEMPEHILRITASQPPAPPHPAILPADDSPAPHPLTTILALLRERSKHDLSLYKPSTLTRRIERRVAVHGLASVADYEAFLHRNPQELDLLFKEMLIGVTSFFRDPPVWQALKDTVLPALLARTAPGTRLRAWVVGCSTGEEAYSLAIVFREAMDAQPDPKAFTLQIFATDLSADAVALARKGHYPKKIADHMAPERLARFFNAEGAGYSVDKSLRTCVLFAQHDVILDPPFTRLDLLSCRNVLIYFSATLQRRLVPLFHYSLRPQGVLLLGGSETVGRSLALFAPLDPGTRLYQRNDQALRISTLDFPVHRHFPSRNLAQEPNVSPSSPSPSPPHLANLQALAEQVLLQQFSPPAVLVTNSGDIVYISGRTGQYLEPAAGKANWNIHVMARPGLRTQIATALHQTLQDKRPVTLQGLKLEHDAHRTVDVTVQRVEEPKPLAGMVMIVFREAADPPPASGVRRRRTARAGDLSFNDGLVLLQEELRVLRQEMRSSEEELQAANEELQSTNEELQSANEELTTSKEEAQSMNEELQTINNELNSKLDDLALAQSDMQNLLNSTDIATLFLDSALNVRRYTERVMRIIHLREGDIGRPLSDLASTLLYPELHADARETLRTLAISEKQITTLDGRWFNVRIMPYRTVANVIQGVVITFVDITDAKELESRLRAA
ncbi:chemotaxis protein CheB [uncultured Sphaerotilus sp.]|uniref:chemotaxis protein CheB n=1 Tax=uncultured Sphaerotilus sp. TaxID=474984 RepID=UPI0030CA40C4